ncbi:MAG: PRC-barrel domain-containing protein [Candidatus Omnitrophota bacterium]
MLRSVMGIKDYRLQARDGLLGRVDDFFFDDEKWGVRYLVVDTNIWLPGKTVLIAPASFAGRPDWESKSFPVALTREEVRNSPDVDVHQPVSRQKEIEVNYYYGWPSYWYAPGQGEVIPTIPLPDGMTSHVQMKETDSHLRSLNEVAGYHIMAVDGEIGHLDDVIVSDEDWSIRYAVADTRNWLPGKRVLIAISWIKKFDWGMRKVHIDLTKERIKHSPPYDPSAPINRELEEALFDYYGRPRHWL